MNKDGGLEEYEKLFARKPSSSNIYSNNVPIINPYNVSTKEVVSRVASTLKILQNSERHKMKPNKGNNQTNIKKTNFAPVNTLPSYDKSKTIPDCSHKTNKFETQLVSDTELISIIEKAESLLKSDTQKGFIKEFDQSFNDERRENNNESIEEAKLVLPPVNLDKIVYQEDVKHGPAEYETVDASSTTNTQILHESLEIENMDETLGIILEHSDRPASPVIQSSNQIRNMKVSKSIICDLNTFENFEKNVIPIVSNLGKSSEDYEKNKTRDNNNSIHEVNTNSQSSKASSIYLEKYEQPESPVLKTLQEIFKVEDSEFKGKSNIINDFEDEILFSSDEENYVHKSIQELPFTCVLETSFYEQKPENLDKTLFVGFQTASNASIKISSESIELAKSMLGNIDEKDDKMTLSELVKKCDEAYNKSQMQFTDISKKQGSNIDMSDLRLETKSKILPITDYKAKSFAGFQTASNKQIKLETTSLNRVNKVFQGIDVTEKYVQNVDPIFEVAESNCYPKESTTNDDPLSAELQNIEEVFNESDIFDTESAKVSCPIVKTEKPFKGFTTASNKNIVLSDNALNKVKNVFHDIELEMKDTKLDNDIPSSSKTYGNGFKTASNKIIDISNQALLKSKKIFDDIICDNKEVNNSEENRTVIKMNDDNLDNSDGCVKLYSNSCQPVIVENNNVFLENDIANNCLENDKTKIQADPADNCDYEPPFYGFSSKLQNRVYNEIICSNHPSALIVDQEKDLQIKQNVKILHSKVPSDYKIDCKSSFRDKTADNRKEYISDVGLAKTKTIFQDQVEPSSKKVIDINTDLSSNNKENTIPTFSGFCTASDKQIKISYDALKKCKALFQDIDSDLDQFIAKPAEARNVNINQKKAYDKCDNMPLIQHELPLKTAESVFGGFKTASNKNIIVSDIALVKTKKFFQDINDVEESKEVKSLIEVRDLQAPNITENSRKVATSPIVNDSVQFKGFQTASKKKVEISTKALLKCKTIFQDIVSNSEVDLDINEQEDIKTAGFTGFQTASNKKVKISDEALAKCKMVFKDIESDLSRDVLNTKIHLETNENINLDVPQPKTVSFSGFQTASSKKVEISDEALAKCKILFKDIEPDLCQENTKNNLETKENNLGVYKPIMAGFSGFQTASNKKVEISDEAIAKCKILFRDIESDLCQENTENNLQAKENNLDVPKQKTAGFGFHTASKKKVEISDHTLAKCKTLFKDIELDVCPENNVKNLEAKINNPLGVTKSAAGFSGFQTASNKKVAVSETALDKCKALFQDIDADLLLFPPQTEDLKTIPSGFNGFQTSNKKRADVSETALAKSKTLFQDIEQNQRHLNVIERNENVKSETKRLKEEPHSKLAVPERKEKEFNNSRNVKEMLDLDTQILDNFQQELNTEDFVKSPEASKRSGSPILSCPKAKRRSVFKTPYNTKTMKKVPEKVSAVEITRNNEKTIIDFDDSYKKIHKFKLKDLASIENDNKTKITIDPFINQFDFDSILNIEFQNERNELTNDKINIDNIKEHFLKNIDKSLVPEGWLENHLKLILWKLISYEIRFPKTMKTICTVKNVIDQLKYRYDKELYSVQRPALRKILEKDDIASKTMVLCVSQILVDGISTSSENTTSNIELVLTDGWYCIRAIIDKMLTKLVLDGKINVGSKIVTHGAELVGCEQGVAPWEDTSKVRLKIFGNSTKRARWDSRLGFTGSAAILNHLSKVTVDGGKVSKMRLYVSRIYPMLYVERFEDGSTVTRSEKLEQIYQNKFERDKQKYMEKIYEDVEKEVCGQDSQDSDQSASYNNKRTCLDTGSQIAKVLKKSNDPMEFRSHLTSSQNEQLTEYTNRQREYQISKIQNRIQEKLAKSGLSWTRNVVVLLKIRVVGIDGGDDVKITKGMLSIWRPSDAIIELLREDHWIDVMNVVPTAFRYSELQLSAGRQSIFHRSKQKTTPKIDTILNQLSRNCHPISELARNLKLEYNEVDTAGLIFAIEPSSSDFDKQSNKMTFQNVYLTDDRRNFLVVNFWGGIKKFGFENVLDIGTVVACINLQSRIGNTKKSVPHYRATEFTYFTKTPKYTQSRKLLEKLHKEFSRTNKLEFCKECLKLQNENSRHRYQFKDMSPYRINKSEYNLLKHKIFIDSPLATNVIKYDDLNLNGLDFESTFKQTENISPEMLARKQKVNEKIARLKMYGEPPPLTIIHIKNKSLNASKSYVSPFACKESSEISKITPSNSAKDCNKYNVTSNNLPNLVESGRLSEIENMDVTYVKKPVNPVRIDFDKIENISIDQFAEEFDSSPPLSLD